MSNGRAGRRGPVVLVVLDGWGYRPRSEGNAIELGRTPIWHRLWQSLPHTLLEASGREVGLPAGQMGNSEVGHLNLGAGRVVPQDIVRVSDAVASGAFFEHPVLLALCERVRRRGLDAERRISESYLARVVERYARYFYQYDASPLFIVNAEELNPVDSDDDFALLIERLGQMRSFREFFGYAS